MDINKYIAEIRSIDWHSYTNEVPKALISLACAEQESKGGIYQQGNSDVDLLLNAKIANDMLSSIGNNHAGCYFPIVRDALPFIIQVSLFGNHLVARNCAINI